MSTNPRTSTPCTVCGSNPFVSTAVWGKDDSGKSIKTGDLPREQWCEAYCKGYPNKHEPVKYEIDNQTLAIKGVKAPKGQSQLPFKRKAADEGLTELIEKIAKFEREYAPQIVQTNHMFLKIFESVASISEMIELLSQKVDTLSKK